MRLGLLRTRVAKRILVLFIACALLPTTALSLVAYAHVRSEMIGQAEVRLHRDAKTTAMGVLERLTARNAELAILARSRLVPEGNGPTRILQHSGFTALVRASAGEVHPIAGVMRVRIPTLLPRQRSQLSDGRSVLVVHPTATGPVILLGRSESPGNSSAGDVLWGEAPAGAMLGDADTESEYATCLLAPSRGIALSCPLIALVDTSALPRELRDGQPGVARSLVAGEERFVATWPVFLGYEFAAPDWRVLQSEPASDVLGGLARFKTSYLQVSVLSLIVVFLLSNLQIRRSTEPLERLTEGTRRVAHGDFSRQVDIKAGNEFDELAASFNAMTGELQSQFAALSAMEAIDHAALEERGTAEVVDVAMDEIVRSLGAPRVVIALAPTEMCTEWSVCIADPDSRTKRRWSVNPSPLSLTMLTAEHHMARVASRRSPHDWLFGKQGEATTAEDFAVLSLVHDRQLLGIVAIHGPSGAWSAHWSRDVRRLTDRLALALSTVRLVERLDRLSLGTLTAFARAIDANSPWTAGHSERVTAIALVIGQRLALGVEEMATLQRGGLLHDIGKIGVPPSVLDKPGRLSDSELALVQQHPTLGVRILAPIEAFGDVLPIVRHHHERIDGAGYPDGLRGESIPFLARLLAVADVYDAMTSNRPYRDGLSREAATAYLVAGKSKHFDPRVVDAFLAALQAGEVDAALSIKDEGASLARTMEAGRQALLVGA